jgi:drug/metabolite transporter (DMT)-like permease
VNLSPGYLALFVRTVCLGLERPLVKALGQGEGSVAATTLYFGLGCVFILPLWLCEWLRNPAYIVNAGAWLGAALLTGLIYAAAFHAYVWALSVGEVSYLAPLYATAFLWLYALDLWQGNASFSLQAGLGIVTVWLGVVLLNVPLVRATAGGVLTALNPVTLLRQPGAWGMLVYAFGLATARTIDKSVADVAPPLLYAFVNNLPCVLIGLGILAARRQTAEPLALLRRKPGIAWFGAAAGIAAYIALLVALDYFPPSTVEPVTQLSVFIAVALGGLWFHEQVRTRWLPSLLVVLGAALLLWHSS